MNTPGTVWAAPGDVHKVAPGGDFSTSQKFGNIGTFNCSLAHHIIVQCVIFTQNAEKQTTLKDAIKNDSQKQFWAGYHNQVDHIKWRIVCLYL